MYALDTNCLIRWLVRDHEQHVRVIDEILDYHRVHVADMAIAELAWVLKSIYELDDTSIIESIEKVITHENINCNRALFNRVLVDFAKSPKVSFVDVCLAHYAGLSEATLLTFDKTLAKKLPKITKLAE